MARDISPKPQKSAMAHPTTIRMSGYETGLLKRKTSATAPDRSIRRSNLQASSAFFWASVDGLRLVKSPSSFRRPAPRRQSSRRRSPCRFPFPPNVVDGLPDRFSQISALWICIRSIIGRGEIELQTLRRGSGSPCSGRHRPRQPSRSGGPWSAPTVGEKANDRADHVTWAPGRECLGQEALKDKPEDPSGKNATDGD